MRGIRLNQQALMGLINGAYETAQDGAQWQGYLQMLHQAVGGVAAVLLHHDLHHGGGISESVGMDPDGLDLYNRHYHTMDPWAFSPRSACLFAEAGVVTDQQLVPRSALYRSEYYVDFMSRFDRTRMVSMALGSGPPFSGISILRRDRDPEFGEAEVRFLSSLAPHLRRALHIHDRLRTSAEERSVLLDSLDAVPCAVLIVDRSGRVALTNRAGTKLRVEHDGIGICRGVLAAASTDSNRRLAQLVASTAHDQQIALLGGTMLLQRLTSSEPLHVLVAPVRRAEPVDAAHRSAGVIVFIGDPSRNILPSEFLLRQYYGLTRSEAEVAARIAVGRSLADIAQERGITIQTVRWYSKQVLAKTDCSSRAQLVRKLTVSLPGLFPDC
jgi:DNA-binding CsgD family transcriptional regulator